MAIFPKVQTNLVHVGRAANLFRLGNNVTGIFIPLVIIKSGGALWTVTLFYLLYASIKICINYPLMKVIQKRGTHFGMGAGFAFGALQIMCILGYSSLHQLLFLIAAGLSYAFANGFIWNSQHYYISSNMDSETQSSSIAAIEVYGRLADIIGPIIGGLVGAEFGTTWLLLVSVICMASTIMPLRNMKQLGLVKSSERLKYSISGAPRRDVFANFCFNIEASIGTLVWPIYLATALASYKSIGSVAAIAAVVAILTTMLAGNLGDKGKDRQVLKQGVVVASAVDLIRLLATTPLAITLVGAAYKSSLAYFLNPWTSIYYGHAKTGGAQYIISMEIACDLAYVAVFGVLLILALSFSNSHIFFNSAFVIAAVAAWGCLLISRAKLSRGSTLGAAETA